MVSCLHLYPWTTNVCSALSSPKGMLDPLELQTVVSCQVCGTLTSVRATSDLNC